MNHDNGSMNEEEVSMGDGADDKKKGVSSSRARNRTVMLTPEMTGQVRALLHKEQPSDVGTPDPLEELLPPMVDWDSSPARTTAEGGTKIDNSPPAEVAPAFNRRPDSSAGLFGNVASRPEPSSFDPMTSVGGAMQTREVPTIQPQTAPSGSANPSFSVNPTPAPTATPVAAPAASAKTWLTGKSKIVGMLVSYDNDPNGEVFPVRSGRWLITSRATDHGDYIIIDDETISPLHAILRATKDGKLQVLDQLSEHGTGIIRAGEDEEIEIAGGLEPLYHGDTVRFGERYYLIGLVPEANVVADDAE
jgi:hypothetical protein